MLNESVKTKTACKVRKNGLSLGISLKKNMETLVLIATSLLLATPIIAIIWEKLAIRHFKKHIKK